MEEYYFDFCYGTLPYIKRFPFHIIDTC